MKFPFPSFVKTIPTATPTSSASRSTLVFSLKSASGQNTANDDPRTDLDLFAQSRGFIARSEAPNPPPPPSNSIPRPSIPKAFTDKVSALDSQSAAISDRVDAQERGLRLVTEDYGELRERVEDLEIVNQNLQIERDDLTAKVDNLLEQIVDLASTSAAQHEALEKFGALFESMGGSVEVSESLAKKNAKASKKALKSTRDNVLNVGFPSFSSAQAHEVLEWS